jgi:hypothetical protein
MHFVQIGMPVIALMRSLELCFRSVPCLNKGEKLTNLGQCIARFTYRRNAVFKFYSYDEMNGNCYF